MVLSSEPAAHHSARQIPRETGAVEGVGCETGGVAEFVAAGEGEGVCDCEDEGDYWGC